MFHVLLLAQDLETAIARSCARKRRMNQTLECHSQPCSKWQQGPNVGVQNAGRVGRRLGESQWDVCTCASWSKTHTLGYFPAEPRSPSTSWKWVEMGVQSISQPKIKLHPTPKLFPLKFVSACKPREAYNSLQIWLAS